MKSTKSEKSLFSMEDLEKGLMLAGYIMPGSISELNEREALEDFEKQSKDSSKNVYFRRVVLAAEIASKLHSEPSLGRVKFQKLVYLCEHAAEMDLGSRYKKQAAGPFDNKFMHTIDKEFKKNKWFLVQKQEDKSITRYRYIPLEKAEGYKAYYDNYFSRDNEKIQFIIELFRKKNTEYTELATTVFACFKELSGKGQKITKDALLQLFYNWSESKKRFTEKEVLDSFKWLAENGLIQYKYSQ